MSAKVAFIGLMAAGLIMVGLACISAVFLADFPVFYVFIGTLMALAGGLGFRGEKKREDR